MTNDHLIDQHGEIYSTPIEKSVVLKIHEVFSKQLSEIFDAIEDLPYSFTKTNLFPQMKYRMISIVADPFSEQVILEL